MQRAGALGLQLAPGGCSQEPAVGVGGVGPSQGAKASGIDGFYPEVDELSPPGQQCGAWGWAGPEADAVTWGTRVWPWYWLWEW